MTHLTEKTKIKAVCSQTCITLSKSLLNLGFMPTIAGYAERISEKGHRIREAELPIRLPPRGVVDMNFLFGSRKKIRLLVQCPDLSMKISSFSETPYYFYEILHSRSTPKSAPACAMTSNSYDWDLRNIAQKKTKKRPFLEFFDFLKNFS